MEQENAAQASRPDSVGPAVGIIIILIVIVLGGWYFFKLQSGESAKIEENVTSISAQSESDELESIEADLNATEIDSLDAELESY